MITHIPVRTSFSWMAEPITVQFGYKDEDGHFEVEDCNHAGSYTEVETSEYPNPNGADFIETHEIEYCDKCPAWRVVVDSPNYSEWQYE